MSMIIRGNQSVRRIELKNADGTVAGTISISSPAKKKKLRLQYNFKEISARILRTKTSGSARQVVTNARQKVAQLRRMSKSENYDETELESAIRHAEAMARVARKRMKHLQEEERAGAQGGLCEAELEERNEERAAERTGQTRNEKRAEHADREMERLMQEYQELMQEAMEELEDIASMEEFSEELAQLAFDEDMDPEDLELLKKKHRASELREIVEADMKYLKAMFDRLQREKQSVGSSFGATGSIGSSDNSGGFGSSGAGSGVALQLGGVDVPVQAPAPEAAAIVEGGAIDTTV